MAYPVSIIGAKRAPIFGILCARFLASRWRLRGRSAIPMGRLQMIQLSALWFFSLVVPILTRTTRKADGVRHHMLKSLSAGTWVFASLMAAQAPIMYQQNGFSLVADMPNIMPPVNACVAGSLRRHTIGYRRCGKQIRLYHRQRAMYWCLCVARQHWSVQVLLLPMLLCSAIHW